MWVGRLDPPEEGLSHTQELQPQAPSNSGRICTGKLEGSMAKPGSDFFISAVTKVT